MYRFSCQHCGKHLSYRIEQLGKKIKCPKCRNSLQVGMQQKSQTARADGGGYSLVAPSERKKLFIASGLLAVAIVMVWYSFF